MAKQTIVRLRDDIDGTEASQTVQFSWAGTAYEIDLNKKNAAQFEQIVQPYLKAARRVGSTSRRRAATKRGGRSDVSAIRSWAAGNGYELSVRGRIPNAVIEAYNAAQRSPNGATTAAAPARKAAKKAPAKRAATRKPAKRSSAARKAVKK